MTNRNQPSAATPHPIFAQLDALARQCGLITRRSRKFSAQGFVLSLMQGAIRGTSSLNHLAMALGTFEEATLSRQALHKRFSPESSDFLQNVIGALIAHRQHERLRPLQGGPFRRVLVEDTTVISMAKSNATDFPNNGNGQGATAGAKVRLLSDLLGGDVLASRLQEAREPDQALALDLLEHCQPGDLVLRDMGFFTLEALRGIEARGASWISRLPASISVSALGGTRLETLLKKTRHDRIELPVILGSRRWNQQPHHARLIATRLDPQQAAAQRRHRRRESKKRRATPSDGTLLRAGWRLILTNLDPRDFPGDQADALYAGRWSIEIGFRAFKQACHLGLSLNHKTDPWHIEALILAALIFQLLSLREHALARARAANGPAPSLEKLTGAYAAWLNTLCAPNLHRPFAPDPRHLQHDKRKRPTLLQSFHASLS